MNPAIDPWSVASRERVKYQEQFNALQPQNDIVTGQQARGFFLQSQLPPQILGEIWSLADTDSDGKMNIIEFSIACKLINLKLRGFEIPKSLPPTLLASLTSVGGTPTLSPTVGSPLNAMKADLTNLPPARPALPPQTLLQHIPQQIPQSPQAISQQIPPQLIPHIPVGNAMPNASILPPLSGVVASNIPPVVGSQPNIAPTAQTIVSPTSVGAVPLVNNIISPTGSLGRSDVNRPGGFPAPPTPPGAQAQSPPERAASIESPGSAANVEWAIKGPAKLKFTQLFNTTDRTRSGYLTGAQARNLMVQSKLPQNILAQIWTLSDMDSDGRLGCEEFVLAMYLCDIALQGEVIPTKLPPELIPPTFRKVASRHGSIASAVGSTTSSRHGSVSSQGAGTIVADTDHSLIGLPGQISFEDKRKENFDKGQAELERRRKVLQDIQRKEQDERERKEREEVERREKARLEAERKQHEEEIERQLAIQREHEEKEEKRKREIEQKETARKEMEKQRQMEWEKQRIAEMQQQRQREQDSLLKLKAQNQTYNVELSTLNEKIKELSQKICDTRVNVTSVKTVIDGMRSTRDSQMTEMTQLKARIKEQNSKLVQLSQEKAKMDSKSKSAEAATQEAFSNKQMLINQLKGKVDISREEITSKQSDVTVNSNQLSELKIQLTTLIENSEDIYSNYKSQRNAVLEMKNNKKNESFTSAWDNPPATSAWAIESAVETTPVPVAKEETALPGYVKYRAVYEFFARNSDEITFQPGDIVMVPLEQNAEPGWLAGEINGHTGWFPETYVEKCEDELSEDVAAEAYTELPAEPVEAVEPVEPVAEDVSEPIPSEAGECYVSCYPYQSAEAGDLIFDIGEYIMVTKKDGDWWTGTIGTRTGIFPSNYVQPLGSETETTTNDALQEAQKIQQNIADEARNQEEADTEVSEINTQQTNKENVQEIYSRPMSSSSTGFRGSKKGEVAQVIAPYEATSTEQLSLQRGQLIMIRKKTDSGWWEGELQARGRRRQIGWFPATYVKVLQSGRLSGRSTPVSGGRVQMNETILDKVIALYPYKAQNDDELSFEKDDIISVLGRDEPEWWRGECQGLTGLFPSNYVGPFASG